MEKFTTTHSKNGPPKYIIVWATPILWSTPKKIICLLNPNTVAQKVFHATCGDVVESLSKIIIKHICVDI